MRHTSDNEHMYFHVDGTTPKSNQEHICISPIRQTKTAGTCRAPNLECLAELILLEPKPKVFLLVLSLLDKISDRCITIL